MFDTGGSGPVWDEAAAARVVQRAGETDSALRTRLTDPEAVLLILDEAGERIRYGSKAAIGLRQAISDEDGRLLPGLRIGEQIARVSSPVRTAVLLRLHLDSRRIAPPALMTLLRAETDEGQSVVILMAAAPLPRLRPRPGSPPLASTIAQAPEAQTSPILEAPSSVVPGAASANPITLRQRFTWRCDANDTVIALSGPPGDALRARMLGQRWQALSASGALRDAEGLIAAVSQARTFRAIPVTLVTLDGTVVELEFSGAPVDRKGHDMRGFGVVRAVLPPDANTPSPLISDPLPPAPIEHSASTGIPLSEASEPPVVPTAIEADAEAEPVRGAELVSASLAPVPPGPVSPESDAALSSNEHAAFREIARALGARFAGDDGQGRVADRGLPCAVMPFPVQPARNTESVAAGPDAAMVATLERLPAGVLVYRGDRVLFANRRLLDLTGYPDTEALDGVGGVERLFRGLVPHARESGDTPLVLTARDGGRLSVLVEHSVLDWAGQPADLLLARDAQPSEAARAGTAAAIAQDFADRRAADALQVLDTLEDGIATLDDQARILTLNRRAAVIFGVDPREVVGASFLGLFAHENAVEMLARLHAEPGAAPLPPVRVAVRATGAPLQVKILPLGDESRRRLCAVLADESAPSRREAEASDGRRAAEAASLNKSDFLAGVSHEIRTPINGILGFADLMLAEKFGPLGSERYREYLQDIHTSGTHVLELVNDLLDLARIEAGRLDLTVTEIPLNEVVARCVALLQPQASRERIVLRTSFSSDLPVLMADERSVRQAALNIIANAIAFTEAGGQVIVSTTRADRGEIALRVRDTGIGMTPDEVEVALQPFRQIRQPGPRKGTGLGLPLTKALVEANHGRFRIESRKDEGTLVEMLFPADAVTRRA